ncbi:MAG: mannitol-/sugar-/sorbitol-6-phosphatase [Gaiellaceae bacterium]|nr:mannitol-/sugar-/sorbitol-6-phosphatase [Gaiellaceae bacterium]
MIRRLAAVLADMDGTLVDSRVVVERHWRLFGERHGLDPEPFIAAGHGRRTSDVLRELAAHLDAVAEARTIDAGEETDLDGLVAVPGALELLAALPPSAWAVVTSAHRSLALSRLAAVGLPVPEVLVCGDEIAHGKPDPEGYLRGAALLGAAPADCLVLEDVPAGIAAGRAAGALVVVAVATTFPVAALEAADAVVADLRGLGDVLEKMGRVLPGA